MDLVQQRTNAQEAGRRRRVVGPALLVEAVLRGGAVVLALVLAYIHWTLGGIMFTANAAGYALLASALIVPIPLARRYRWVVRLALMGFAAATIGGWVLFGARYWLGYVTVGLELLTIAIVAADLYRADGGPAEIVQRIVTLLRGLVPGGHRPAGT
jgi:hypothetical protein